MMQAGKPAIWQHGSCSVGTITIIYYAKEAAVQYNKDIQNKTYS